MTRKDYVALSAALRNGRADYAARLAALQSPVEIIGFDRAAAVIADALAQDNRAFDRVRFLRDAGVQS